MGVPRTCSFLTSVFALQRNQVPCRGYAGFQKAFDTVPHKTILGSLKAQGLDQHSISIIEGMYREACTQIGDTGDRIALRRGVKQGDPLSPLLFNIVMDPVVRALQDEGDSIRGQVIGGLVFADEIIVLSGSAEGAQAQLDLVTQLLADRGMKLNPLKCKSFQIGSTSKSWVVRDPGLSVDGVSVSGAKPSTALRYLGVNYMLSKGLRDDTQ